MFGAHPGVNTDKIHYQNMCQLIGPRQLPRPQSRGFISRFHGYQCGYAALGHMSLIVTQVFFFANFNVEVEFLAKSSHNNETATNVSQLTVEG